MNRDMQEAFGLVELLASVTIVAVLLSIAVPEFRRVIESNRDEALRDQLLAHLSQTRMQAIASNRTHLLCGSSDGKKCSGDWNSHWILMPAANGEPILSQQPNSSKNLCWKGLSDDIYYRPNGTSPTSNGRFALCDGNTLSWQLVINRQGRVRTAGSEEGNACC